MNVHVINQPLNSTNPNLNLLPLFLLFLIINNIPGPLAPSAPPPPFGSPLPPCAIPATFPCREIFITDILGRFRSVLYNRVCGRRTRVRVCASVVYVVVGILLVNLFISFVVVMSPFIPEIVSSIVPILVVMIITLVVFILSIGTISIFVILTFVPI